MTYAELKTKIEASGASNSTKIRSIHFERHSKSDGVAVGYDADKDEIRVVQKN